MLKRMFFIAVFAANVFLCGAPAFAAEANEGPAESVDMLQKAIDTNDMPLVEKYLDLDAVLEKGVESIIVDEDVLRDAAKYPAINMALALGPNVGNEILRTLLGAETREYIRHGVVSGAFAGKPVSSAPPYNGMFAKAFKGGEKDKRTFGIASVTKSMGDTAYVKTSITGGRKNKTLPLDLVVRKQNGVWRIVEVANAAQLFGGGKQEQ